MVTKRTDFATPADAEAYIADGGYVEAITPAEDRDGEDPEHDPEEPAGIGEGQLKTVEDIRAYIFAGRARFTLRSKKTGQRFTFRVSKAKERPGDKKAPPFFVSVLTGPDNEAHYTYMGCVWGADGRGKLGAFKHSGKKGITEAAPSVVAFRWFMEQVVVAGSAKAVELLECWHTGRCGKCGRVLTVPESVGTGFGPECAHMVQGAVEARARYAMKKARPAKVMNATPAPKVEAAPPAPVAPESAQEPGVIDIADQRSFDNLWKATPTIH